MSIFEHLLSPEGLSGLTSLTLLLITLAFDNVIFIGLLSSKLSTPDQKKARLLGMVISVILNISLILCFSAILGESFLKNIFLGLGGAFLLAKSIIELTNKISHKGEDSTTLKDKLWPVVGQTALVDLIFSIDGTLTAVGLSNDKIIQISAIIISVSVMFTFSWAITKLLIKYEDLKIVAYLFLTLIGATLIMIAFKYEAPHGLLYGMMLFGLIVQICNIAYNKNKHKPKT